MEKSCKGTEMSQKLNDLKFSIITVLHDGLVLDHLRACVESVAKQRTADFSYEHIIVDNDTSDNIIEYIKTIQLKDNRIKYLKQKNQGLVSAMKEGIKYSTGEYVIIIGPDDMLPSGSLMTRSGFIDNNKNVDFFYGLADWIDDYGLPIKNKHQSLYFESFLYENMLISNCIHIGTPTIRSSALKDIKWPEWLDESWSYFLWLEILRPENNYVISFVEKVIFRYRHHISSYLDNLNTQYKYDNVKNLDHRIRLLHDASSVFLAEKAYECTKGAEQSHNYQEILTQKHDKELEYANKLLDYYRKSRIVRYAVKSRNVLRGQIFDRIQRTALRLDKLLSTGIKEPRYEVTTNQLWTNNKPLVSIVTPFYNRSDTMPETISSVLGQSFQDFEYIIVDDGSTDKNSVDYLRMISHPKIKIIKTINQGVAEARNTGIRAAKGKYILCLDSDDIIDVTYIEKAVIILESNPETSIVSYDMQMFGNNSNIFRYASFDARTLMDDNTISTAAVFRKSVWEDIGGYKTKIGYEDWEFWVNAAEHGHFAFHVPEIMFYYRTAANSRYVDDLLNHSANTKTIKGLHQTYRHSIKEVYKRKQSFYEVTETSSAFMNYSRNDQYLVSDNKPNVLITIPWMSFGGVSTLIYNYSMEIKDDYNMSFITGLKDKNEWEYKFRRVSNDIYHLPNLFREDRFYLGFLCNYIQTRNISVLHIIHNGFIFHMLPEIKKMYPKLKVVVTLFNDKVDYFDTSMQYIEYIDVFTSDNRVVDDHYKKQLTDTNRSAVKLIENGIDVDNVFSPLLFNRAEQRSSLGISRDELAVFFIGRLSVEKNPDVFLEASKLVIEKHKDVRFFVIGDGPMRGNIEGIISRIGGKTVQYLGYQSDIARYLSAADIFVLPSSIEGFPLSIPEAMAMEVVVVASKVGAIPDIIENDKDGYIVKPGNPSGIASAIIKLRNNPNKLKVMKNNARKKVIARYSSKKLGENYRNLYEEILE